MIQLNEYLINRQTKQKEENNIYFMLCKDLDIHKKPQVYCYVVSAIKDQKVMKINKPPLKLNIIDKTNPIYEDVNYIAKLNIRSRKLIYYLFTKEDGLTMLEEFIQNPYNNAKDFIFFDDAVLCDPTQKLTPKDYAIQIKDHLKNDQVI